MDELYERRSHTAETAEKVERLNTLLTDIEDIVEFITDMADQTSILALDANIDAARAGSEGDGFTVVANEVKNLASESECETDGISIARPSKGSYRGTLDAATAGDGTAVEQV